jgi:valyl-tRNA synthetase
MADAIYHFVWHTFCDWYVELVKGAFDEETKRVAAWAFDQILVMLHPLMPFITEELWHAMGERPYELIVAEWPQPAAQVDPRAKAEIEWVVELISQFRTARSELSIPPRPILDLHVKVASLTEDSRRFAKNNEKMIERLARVKFKSAEVYPDERINIFDFNLADRVAATHEELKRGSLSITVPGLDAYAPLEGVIDIEAEKARLSKGAEAAEKERDSLAARLANPNFTERAKPEAVEKARSDHEAKAAEAERLRAALKRLG